MPASDRYTVEIAASAHQVLAETVRSPGTYYGPNRPITYEATLADGSKQFEVPRRWVGDASELPAPLWPGHIPSGQVTLVVGDAGSGKTAVLLDLVARASLYSVWPDGTPCAKSVVLSRRPHVLYVTRQDDAALYRSRLKEMGVDLDRFHWLSRVDPVETLGNGPQYRDFVFPHDLPMVENEVIENPRQQLVVIDSLADLCDKPYQVSRTLRKLNEMAFLLNIPILVTLPGKCSINSQGFLRVHSRYQAAAAPNVWCVVTHPDDPERTLFIPQRASQPKKPSGYEFRFGEKSVTWMKNARVDPLDPLHLRKSIDTFLKELLVPGPVSAQAVLKQGELCGGFTPKQLRAGAARQGILSLKSEGFGAEGRWDWYTPAQRKAKFPEMVVEEADLEPLPMERDIEIGETERADYVEPQTAAERLAAEEQVWQNGRIKPGSRGVDGSLLGTSFAFSADRSTGVSGDNANGRVDLQ